MLLANTSLNIMYLSVARNTTLYLLLTRAGYSSQVSIAEAGPRFTCDSLHHQLFFGIALLHFVKQSSSRVRQSHPFPSLYSSILAHSLRL